MREHMYRILRVPFKAPTLFEGVEILGPRLASLSAFVLGLEDSDMCTTVIRGAGTPTSLHEETAKLEFHHLVQADIHPCPRRESRLCWPGIAG